MKPIWRHRTVLFCLIVAGIVCGRPRNLDAGRRTPVPVIFDTDIMGDVDDVGAVAVLHALADAGEARILAMGVSAKHPDCVPCLDALNTWFGRPDVPIGVVKGPGFRRASKYNTQIAREFPHDLRSAAQAPDAAKLYRRILAQQPDHSVVMISVGQLTNFRNLLHSTADRISDLDGTALVKQKVKAWVCMGGRFPSGKEANLIHDGPAAADAVAHWPTPIVFSGFEIGLKIHTGAGLKKLPPDSPVRRAYKLYNGLTNRNSWDQTAVLYAIRGLAGGLRNLWDIRTGGVCQIDRNGVNRWQPSPDGQHSYLIEKAPPAQIARLIESLMLHRPRRKTGSGRATSATPRPNIILCMADDQGYGDVGYYGNPIPRTPVLDEMARSGLRFDRFYAAAPVCSPTRGSVLTGRHPNRFGCFSWGFTLRPQEVTVAEALKRTGYTTGHFGKWHLGSLQTSSPVDPGHSGFDEWVSSPNFYDNSPLMSHNGKVVHLKGESSLVTVNAALDFIRKASGRKQPFLAVIWFGSPHLPHQALPAERELYKNLPARLQNYYGEITGIDRAMGHLRKELRTLNIAENTLLWYTSDNGPRNPLRKDLKSTGGLSGRKGTLWEGGIRVPTIIEWPARIRSPRVTSLPCSTVDIYPTLLSITGVTVPDQPRPLDGIDLLPLIDGKMTARSKPLGFWVYTSRGHRVRSTRLLEELARAQAAGRSPKAPQPATGQITGRYSETERPGHAAWMEGRYKLHRIPQKDGRFTYRLFDLVKDPREKTDLSGQQSERTEQMRRALAKWQQSVIGSLNGRDYPQR